MRTAQAPASAGAVDDLPETAARLLSRVREERPRVHALTNAAAQVLTANVLLAVGAVPSLTTAPDEVPAFTARAAALVVNLGTLDAERRAAIPSAIGAARALEKPWVLDPVFVDASPPRLALARQCLAAQPALLRCNGSEFAALTGREASPEAVRAYAAGLPAVVAVTGPVDHVTDGKRSWMIENGHPLMSRVTALGCAATALIAAFAALEADRLAAAAGALLVVGIAGEIAAETAQGPGSFMPAWLDALYRLDAPAVVARARIA